MGHGMGGWADGLAGAWCGETGSKISHWSMEDLPECMCVPRLFANAVRLRSKRAAPTGVKPLSAETITQGPGGERSRS